MLIFDISKVKGRHSQGAERVDSNLPYIFLYKKNKKKGIPHNRYTNIFSYLCKSYITKYVTSLDTKST